MAQDSKIQWTDHTFNPWIGCTKVSTGCANCYAENLMDTRLKQVNWGKGNPRKRTTEANWKQPLKWNREAGTPRKVFCSSLADWLDDEVPIEWLANLLSLIDKCNKLDWLLLTKRPENFIKKLAPAAVYLEKINDPAFITIEGWITGKDIPINIWVGTSVENQEQADIRIPQLLKIPSAVRFLSCEPLLGQVEVFNKFTGDLEHWSGVEYLHDFINWIIAGGESGPKARPMKEEWALDLMEQCEKAHDGVPFFFKQMGGSGKDKGGDLLDGKEYKEFPEEILK